MKKIRVGTRLAIGSACAISLSAYLPANAAEQLFSIHPLPHGYMVADATDAKAMDKAIGENTGDEGGTGKTQGANATAEKKPEAKPSSNEGKVSDGWCGDSGRCGYKRRWP
jgi:hypothetical protein